MKHSSSPRRLGTSSPNATSSSSSSSSSSPSIGGNSPSKQHHQAVQARVESKLQLVAVMQTQLNDIVVQLQNPKDPQSTVDRHIHLLHQYNQVRDVALGLIGMVAQQQGVTTHSVMSQYGLTESD